MLLAFIVGYFLEVILQMVIFICIHILVLFRNLSITFWCGKAPSIEKQPDVLFRDFLSKSHESGSFVCALTIELFSILYEYNYRICYSIHKTTNNSNHPLLFLLPAKFHP